MHNAVSPNETGMAALIGKESIHVQKIIEENQKKTKDQANKAMADSDKAVNNTEGGNMQLALLQEQNELLRALLRTTKSNTSDMYSSA